MMFLCRLLLRRLPLFLSLLISQMVLTSKEVMVRISVNHVRCHGELRSLLQPMRRIVTRLAATLSSEHGAGHASKEEAAVWDTMGARGKKTKFRLFPGIMVFVAARTRKVGSLQVKMLLIGVLFCVDEIELLKVAFST